MVNQNKQKAREITPLFIILILAFVHGLIYVFIMPPWQHYDEPNHFEYVWLVAHRDRLPEPGDYDLDLNNAVISSMHANGFYRGIDNIPDLGTPENPAPIPGFQQLSEPSLYYIIAGLPLRLLEGKKIESQLIAVRLVSLILYLIVISISWLVARDLTSPGHTLRWLLPFSLALLPGFTELMTAVNNDVIAVVVFSLFFWVSIKLIKYRFSIVAFLILLGTTYLTVFSKNTAMIAIVLFPFVVLFTIFRGKWRRIAWILMVICAIVGLFMIVLADDAFSWYRATSQSSPVRQRNEKAVDGNYVFAIDGRAEVIPSWSPALFQIIPDVRASIQESNKYTLGVWMWASKPVSSVTPVVKYSKQSHSQEIDLAMEPRYYIFQMEIPKEIKRVWIHLRPFIGNESRVEVYYDGLVFAQGQYPVDQIPDLSLSNSEFGMWGGKAYKNLIRNPSAETPGIRIQPRIDNLVSLNLPDQVRLSIILASFLDWPGSGVYYKPTAQRLFETFWAKFGWGHVRLIWNQAYIFLIIFTLLGFVGVGIFLFRNLRKIDLGLAFFWGLTLTISWGFTLVRGSVYISAPGFYIPVSRHAYPAIIPTMAVLSIGWLEITSCLISAWFRFTKKYKINKEDLPSRLIQINHKLFLFIFLWIFLTIDILSILSVIQFY